MPARLIDVPLESLPHIDRHTTLIDATPAAVWEALIAVTAKATSAGAGPRIAAVLGCAQTARTGEPGRVGSTVPGFVVARSVRPVLLALMGEHRFSRYALIFCSTETASGAVELSAETRAEFPGRPGGAYRALVIGTRGHVVVTTGVLRSVRRRAQRAR